MLLPLKNISCTLNMEIGIEMRQEARVSFVPCIIALVHIHPNGQRQARGF